MQLEQDTPFPALKYGSAWVSILPTEQALGRAAALEAAALIRRAIALRNEARIMIGTGNSQLAVITCLTADPSVDWSRITVFHLDEYVGISPTHPASFRLWLKSRVADKVAPRAVHYLAGDAADLGRELDRYATLLHQAPIDVAFVGFGENGHIAFNDPLVADFSDPAVVKIVTLEPACRRQQVGEGHFPTLDAVPERAISVTCSELLRARSWISCVPESRKAAAVRSALEGPITTACPASIVRTHPHARVFLDHESSRALALQPAGSGAR